MQQSDHRHCPGKLFVVGIGPGNSLDRTARALKAVGLSDVIVGYESYLDKIPDLLLGKEVISSGMKKEKERACAAVERALLGETVSLISSGDSGIFGMAGLALEIIHAKKVDIEVEIVPGVTAASAAAAKLGAPLMLDFAVISLSDLLVPWTEIEQRLIAVAPLSMTVCLYNPKSTKRTRQIEIAAKIFRAHRSGSIPIGICTALGTPEEKAVITTLDRFLEEEITMKSIVIIGSERTEILGPYMVTLRGYSL
jgi:precorrin-3B C17-methyltransferase